MNEENLKTILKNLSIWKKEGQSAPHKPLLVLYALSKFQEGIRYLPYSEVKEVLTILLKRFGPGRQSYHPEEPFVRLCNDGIWELTPNENIEVSNPSNSFLIKNNVFGGFNNEVYNLLNHNEKLIKELAAIILIYYFPIEIHIDIINSIGLSIEKSLEEENLDNGEFQKEQKHLSDTIKHIENQTYYVWELLENKREQFKQRNNVLGDEVAYRAGKMEADALGRAKEEPYFGRFDTMSKEFGNETFYIGKQGVKNRNEDVVVVDWRMPIASVYYNFTPGKSVQKYTVEDEKNNRIVSHQLEVTRKREFTIKNQKLEKMIQQVAEIRSELNATFTDKGEQLTVADDFLREILESSETTGYLKEIIASIQQEQNEAIRQPIDKNIIIQGVAGSGKSSIALHRLSFLLYNNKRVKPEDVLIIGPSNMFLSSFKGLLPDLNLEGIKQSTFQLLALQYLRPFIKNKINGGYSDYFENVLFKDRSDLERKRIEFKGSEAFALVIDILIQEYQNNYFKAFKPITIFESTLLTEDLQKIFDGYSYLPFFKKTERFIEHVGNHFKNEMDIKISDLKEQYNFISGSYVKDGGLLPVTEEKLVKQLEGIYQYKKTKLEKQFKDTFSQWKEKMTFPNPVALYKQILTQEILSAFTNEIGEETSKLFMKYEVKNISYFDLAPLLYLYFSLYDEPDQYRHLVIDEAQDFSYMHFLVFKKITKTMTILGDKDQAIFLGYGQENWDKINELILNKNEDLLLAMNNSYRSTKEIIQVANSVLANQYEHSHNPITPINRSGPEVNFEMVYNGEELINNIKATIKEWKNKYKRIAIIHKDELKAKKLSDYLNSEIGKDVVYINPEEDVKQGYISVLASYNSKGMEFDGVILVNVNEETFPKDNLHARLLYVILTRAQQEVKGFYQDKPSPLLDGFVKPLLKAGSRFDDIL